MLKCDLFPSLFYTINFEINNDGIYIQGVRVMVFNATLNNISVIFMHKIYFCV